MFLLLNFECIFFLIQGVSKYGSDSERDIILTDRFHDSGPSHSRGTSQLVVPTNARHYPYPNMNYSRESFNFEPYHNHSPSVNALSRKRVEYISESDGTFPRNPRSR